MPKLSEVLGTILQNVVSARQQSDAYTASILPQYAADKILKHFPVPKIEMKEMELSLKFAITSIDENGEMLVAVSSQEMTNIPEAHISVGTFMLSMRNYHVSEIASEGNSSEYQLTEQ